LLLQLADLLPLPPCQGEEFLDLELELTVSILQLGDALLGVGPFQFDNAAAQGAQVLPHVVRHLAQRSLVHHAGRRHAAILSAQPLVATVRPVIAYGDALLSIKPPDR
jgi:hypothetical protein